MSDEIIGCLALLWIAGSGFAAQHSLRLIEETEELRSGLSPNGLAVFRVLCVLICLLLMPVVMGAIVIDVVLDARKFRRL